MLDDSTMIAQVLPINEAAKETIEAVGQLQNPHERILLGVMFVFLLLMVAAVIMMYKQASKNMIASGDIKGISERVISIQASQEGLKESINDVKEYQKTELEEIKKGQAQVREFQHSLDKRLTILESRFTTNHNGIS